jgi:hypothetical protein
MPLRDFFRQIDARGNLALEMGLWSGRSWGEHYGLSSEDADDLFEQLVHVTTQHPCSALTTARHLDQMLREYPDETVMLPKLLEDLRPLVRFVRERRPPHPAPQPAEEGE